MEVNPKELIKAVQNYPEIWDKNNKNYKNNKSLDKAWENISDELNKPSQNLRRRWKYLRDHFRTEYLNFDSYSNYPYFHSLLFLKDQINPDSNKSAISVKLSDEECFNSRQGCENGFDENHSSARPNVAQTSDLDPLSCTHSEQNLRSKPRISTQRKRMGKRKIYSTGGSTNVRDDDEIFFESLLPLVRQLEPAQKIVCRTEIQNIIHKHLSEKGSPKDPPSGLTEQIRNDNTAVSEDTI